MTYVKINNTLYLAEITGRMTDCDFDNRESKTIRLDIPYEDAKAFFVDGASWSIVERYDDNSDVEYDNSAFSVAGDIIDHRDGTVSVKMGKKTEAEQKDEIINILLGGMN